MAYESYLESATTRYLRDYTNEEIKNLIDDLVYLHFVQGELPKNSPVRIIARDICSELGIPYNINLVKDAIMWEVFNRFKKL